MSLVIPYIPTPEEIAEHERLRARSPFPAGSATPAVQATPPLTAAAASPTHTQSTGVPAAPAAQACPGSALAAPATQALPGQRPPRPPLDECLITSAELALLKIPPRPALLDRWLCEGDLGYIFAPRGVGKTWMAMALPGAISRGHALGLWKAGTGTAGIDECGNDIPCDTDADPATPREFTPVPILYVDGEMALKLTQYRNHGLHLDVSHVTYLHHEHMFEIQTHSLNVGEAEDRARLTDVIMRRGYKVLILDNLSSLASGVDENKGMDYEPIAHWLLELRRRKITVIVVHHAGRSGAMRGHSKREDACAWILELREARQETDPGAKFISHFAKPSRNTGDPTPDLLWHFTTDKKSGITDIHCELAINSEYDQFIQHVREGVTNQHDIAEMMGKNRGTISKWATRALQEGRVSGSPRKLLPPKSHADKVCAKAYADDDDDEGDEG